MSAPEDHFAPEDMPHHLRGSEPTPAQMQCGYCLYGPPAICTCGTCDVVLEMEDAMNDPTPLQIRYRLTAVELIAIGDRLTAGCPMAGVSLSPWAVQLQKDAKALFNHIVVSRGR
jgi:hypothetical protein